MKTLNLVGSTRLSMAASLALVYRHANSRDRAMKTQRVKTCQDRPTMETLTAVREPPEEVEERAPPTAWRTRERMSQGMKIQ